MVSEEECHPGPIDGRLHTGDPRSTDPFVHQRARPEHGAVTRRQTEQGAAETPCSPDRATGPARKARSPTNEPAGDSRSACQIGGARASPSHKGTIGDTTSRPAIVIAVERRSPDAPVNRLDGREREAVLAPFAHLTAREAEVLADLMEGLATDVIAERHYVSLATVRSQVRAVLQKLCVNSQLAAVALAYRSGWSIEERATAA